MPSSSKRSRRAESGRGTSRESLSTDQLQVHQLLAGIGDILFRELDADLTQYWPTEYDHFVACPFSKRNPVRYHNVKDFACTGYGFRDIADLRDHIKRVHSNKYGCDNCKERFGCRDNSLDDYKAKHRAQCKASKHRSKLSDCKPEWMSRDQDKRYFSVDFRKKQGLPVEEQYFRIWEALWPGEHISDINIWSRPGDSISRSLLSDVLTRQSVLDEVRTLMGGYGSSYGYGTDQGSGYSPGASSQFDYSQTQASYMANGIQYSAGGDLYTHGTSDFSSDDSMEYDQASIQNNLLNLHAVPKPAKYVVHNTIDSAYGSAYASSQSADHDMPEFTYPSSRSSPRHASAILSAGAEETLCQGIDLEGDLNLSDLELEGVDPYFFR